ncbi:MAG: hypothetical protein L0219_20600 [Phycisphaerales bacterium]|nr:hypothetical protein [Phycisphaerales bacterium]
MRRCISQRGGIVSTLLLSFVTLIAVALAIGWVGWNFASNVRVETSQGPRGEIVKVETPIGSVRVGHRDRIDPKHIGIPVYPGARLDEDDSGGGASVELDLGDERKEFTVVGAVYLTDDSVDQVRDYYKQQFPHCIVSKRGVEYSEGGYKRVIAIRRHRGQTRIALASIGEPAAN